MPESTAKAFMKDIYCAGRVGGDCFSICEFAFYQSMIGDTVTLNLRIGGAFFTLRMCDVKLRITLIIHYETDGSPQ